MEVVRATFAPGVRGLIEPLYPFLQEESITEILINQPQEVFIEKNGVMQRIAMPILTSLYLKRIFLMIANENGQVLSEDLPILSGNLYDGSRVQLVIPPASKYETLSIRKFNTKYFDLGFHP